MSTVQCTSLVNLNFKFNLHTAMYLLLYLLAKVKRGKERERGDWGGGSGKDGRTEKKKERIGRTGKYNDMNCIT